MAIANPTARAASTMWSGLTDRPTTSAIIESAVPSAAIAS
jgi:hypothetical protein